MTLSQELQWRGFASQTTLANIQELDKKHFTFYFGVDPSASSMTVGNLAAAMMVRCFIAHGHKAILLVGGATGMIGDPDGKSEERKLKTFDEVASNKAGIVAEYQRLFKGMDFEVVDNYDWFKDVNYLTFLRDIGKHFSMTQLLDREFVKARIGKDGKGISYAEFSYALIQGYDFLHLNRTKGASLQLCGVDQWGNSILGVELIRKLEGQEAHVYSTPLVINRSTGKKFGKSEGGAVWLNPQETSVYQFYQFWLNADDQGVIDYLKLYTTLTKNEVDALAAQVTSEPQKRAAQKALANAVTAFVHGEARAMSVAKVTRVLFGDEQVSSLGNAEIDTLAAEIPTVNKGQKLSEALVESGLASSHGDARRLLTGNAICINGNKTTNDVQITELSLLKKGKNSFALVR